MNAMHRVRRGNDHESLIDHKAPGSDEPKTTQQER